METVEESEMNESGSKKTEQDGAKKLFSRNELLKLIFPLMVELALTLLVGMIDSVMVSSVGEAAVSGVSLSWHASTVRSTGINDANISIDFYNSGGYIWTVY